jgi:hypothetical protein
MARSRQKVKVKLAIALMAMSLGLAGCIGTIVDATTDAAIAVVKIPFKIGGAAVEMMKGKDPDEVGNSSHSRTRDERRDPADDSEEQGDGDQNEHKPQQKT